MKSKICKFGLFSKPTLKEFKDFIKSYRNVVVMCSNVKFSFFDFDIKKDFCKFCSENENLRIKGFYMYEDTIYLVLK